MPLQLPYTVQEQLTGLSSLLLKKEDKTKMPPFPWIFQKHGVFSRNIQPWQQEEQKGCYAWKVRKISLEPTWTRKPTVTNILKVWQNNTKTLEECIMVFGSRIKTVCRKETGVYIKIVWTHSIITPRIIFPSILKRARSRMPTYRHTAVANESLTVSGWDTTMKQVFLKVPGSNESI